MGTESADCSYFNPRSYKRSDELLSGSVHAITNFNPRSYKRSDLLESLGIEDNIISIHAPTRGATKNYYENVNGSEFQSTLLQEERHGFRVYR